MLLRGGRLPGHTGVFAKNCMSRGKPRTVARILSITILILLVTSVAWPDVEGDGLAVHVLPCLAADGDVDSDLHGLLRVV
jgi:hypothetical protein